MSWHEENFLTKQQKPQKPICILPSIPKDTKLQASKKALKNSKLIKMPIPKFQLDKINDSDIEDTQDLRTSLGVQKETSFLITSQMNNSPFNLLLNLVSVETQTDDFTFVNSLYGEPKIYEIPVEMEIQEEVDYKEEGVQVQSQINQKQNQQKLQQTNPAVLRQCHLQMQSGVMSLSIQNYSFSRSQQFAPKRRSVLSVNQQDNESDKSQEQEELLLQNEPDNDNKQNLFKTANFQHHYTNTDFYTISTPQKSRISGTQSSPDTNGPMRISEREVNMMQTKHVPSARIDEQEYEDLQSRFYILQQENAQKTDQIVLLNTRVLQLIGQLNALQQIEQQRQLFQQRCQLLQTQLQAKCFQLQQAKYILQSKQGHLAIALQTNQTKQLEIQQILQTKDRQLQQLQRQLNDYKMQLSSGQEKYTKQNETYENLLAQKESEIIDLKAEYDRKYELYIISIKQMKQKIEEYEIKMEKMENVIMSKEIKIGEGKEDFLRLKEENSFLMKRIQNMKEQMNSKSSSSVEDSVHIEQSTIKTGNTTNSYQNSKYTNQNINKPLTQRNSPASKNHATQQIIMQQERESSQKLIDNENENNHHHSQREEIFEQNYDINNRYSRVNASRMTHNLQEGNPSMIGNGRAHQKFERNRNQSEQYHENHDSESNEGHDYAENSGMMAQQQGTIFMSESNQTSKFTTHYSFQNQKSHLNQENINTVHHYDNYSDHNTQNNQHHHLHNQQQQQQYTFELQRIILIYERIIENNLSTIEELEEKVLQFLKDALLKQNQAELLSSQLCQYENTLNALMVQKLNMQLENQRLKKLIDNSQHQLALLGSRLIKLAQNNSSLNGISSKRVIGSQSSIEQNKSPSSSSSSIQNRIQQKVTYTQNKQTYSNINKK